MESYKYLVIGGGMAAHSAVKGIREIDSAGEIAMVSSEPHAPYKRPPLSKKLWSGAPEESIWLETASLGVCLRLSSTLTAIDLESKRALDDSAREYAFEKVLFATGGTPRTLPSADGAVVYFRTLDDYRRLRALAEAGHEFVVIGGGFIGSEIAAALAANGKRVTMVFPEPTSPCSSRTMRSLAELGCIRRTYRTT